MSVYLHTLSYELATLTKMPRVGKTLDNSL